MDDIVCNNHPDEKRNKTNDERDETNTVLLEKEKSLNDISKYVEKDTEDIKELKKVHGYGFSKVRTNFKVL